MWGCSWTWYNIQPNICDSSWSTICFNQKTSKELKIEWWETGWRHPCLFCLVFTLQLTPCFWDLIGHDSSAWCHQGKRCGHITAPSAGATAERKSSIWQRADTKRFLRLWDSTSRWRFRCIMDKVFHRRSRGRSCLLARCFTVHWWLVSSSLFGRNRMFQLGECCLGHQAQALVLLVC